MKTSTKKLSASAKMRLFRQCQKAIAAIEKRLTTCDMVDYAKVEKALIEERKVLLAYVD